MVKSRWRSLTFILLTLVSVTFARSRFRRQGADFTGCPLVRDEENPSRYYQMGPLNTSYHRKCSNGLVFNQEKCACVFPTATCDSMGESPLGPQFYRMNDNGEWRDMPCPTGTEFNKDKCECDHAPPNGVDAFGNFQLVPERSLGLRTQSAFAPESMDRRNVRREFNTFSSDSLLGDSLIMDFTKS